MSDYPAGFVPDEAPSAALPAGFVPDAAEQPEKPKVGWLESLARGAAQGATMGFADEIAGGVESLVGNKTYQQARDESRAAFHAAEEAHPVVSTIGQVGGGLATALIPGGAVAKGGGFVAHALRGAATGALSSAGASEASNVQDIARDASHGFVAGGVLGGVLGTAGNKLLRGAGERVEQRTFSALGDRATKTIRDKMADIKPDILGVAKKFDLEKLARAKKPEVLAQRVIAARKEVGANIGAAFEAADAQFMGARTADVVKALGAVKRKYNSPVDSHLRSEIDGLISRVKEQWGATARDRVPLAQLNSTIGKLEKQGFASANLTPAAGIQLKRDLAGGLEGVLQKRFGEIQASAKNLRSAPHLSVRPAFEGAQPAAAKIAELGALNKDYRALRVLEQAAKYQSRLEPFPATGLRQIAGGGLETGALIGSLATGSVLPYLGVKVGIPLAKAAGRGADVALAGLYSAAQRGQVTAQMIQRAIEAGVPRGLVDRFAAGVATEQPREEQP